MPPRTVQDFEFPIEFGYTGSAGKQSVRGYMRGGAVCAPPAPNKASAPAPKAAPPARKGGKAAR